MKKIGINGFGRIGRTFARFSLEQNDIEIALVNDLADIETLAHLFKYDSIHRVNPHAFKISGNSLVFENGKKIEFVSEKDPANIPWAKYGVETVVECAGIFLTKEAAGAHLKAGAKNVILSAPPKDDTKTVVLGVNEEILTAEDTIISNASCTTNCAAPMFKVFMEIAEIESAFVSTVHSFTSDQRLHDAPHKDLRRARQATASIIPTSTGAAKALWQIFPELQGKMSGSSLRVPVSDGSITEITLVVKNKVTVEQINEAFKKASEGKLRDIIRYTDEPLVSVDIVGDRHSVIFDSELTTVTGNMVKIVGWYDNEAGYSARLLDLAKRM
ncbi:MAG: glyceraldehyde-3-phosphate dehydrogenase [Crocinitomicaceae bacterium]|jgi:glyceraldehyde 3-phosphate dehydrogenase|nr:glyceraldehyde-3-phosphate dehydrogenase [Crocinitomicaceae bacterium]